MGLYSLVLLDLFTSSVTDAAEHVQGRLKRKRALNFAILMIHFH
jgi:hypothetical protein